ncbi:MAG: D-alanine--D-alanine ligase [Gemmatimonadetes bacterium]|nr:D-alanine--D-alanine ligase [Gemmatimonadota bacterium]
MGGTSGERDVSLSSGAQVARALRQAGHEVVAVDTARGVLAPAEERHIVESGVKPLPPEALALDLLATGDATALTRAPEVRNTDVVFLTLHGGAGEDGTLQALLNLVGIPYVGSGPLGCGLAMDKDLAKRLFRQAGIPTPDWLMGPASREQVGRLGYPVVVKPNNGGSTLGLSVVHSEEELDAAMTLAAQYDQEILIERFIRGRELTVGILGERALAVGEIIPKHEIFDYECKYQPGLAEEIFPADLPDQVARRVQEIALRAHRALKLRDFSRIDFVLDGDEVAWCLEANALPGMTATSLLPQSAVAAGIPFPELCSRIGQLAMERWERESRQRPGAPRGAELRTATS